MSYLETAIINIIIIIGAAGISVSTLLLNYTKERFKSPVLVRS
jgi:hypothetical protein